MWLLLLSIVLSNEPEQKCAAILSTESIYHNFRHLHIT